MTRARARARAQTTQLGQCILYLELLQISGIAPFLVVSDACDTRKPDGNTSSCVEVRAAELCTHDFPHRGDLQVHMHTHTYTAIRCEAKNCVVMDTVLLSYYECS